jgi:transcription elongation factor Elf1
MIVLDAGKLGEVRRIYYRLWTCPRCHATLASQTPAKDGVRTIPGKPPRWEYTCMVCGDRLSVPLVTVRDAWYTEEEITRMMVKGGGKP